MTFAPCLFACLGLLLCLTLPASALVVDIVPIEDESNAADDTGFGSVDYYYEIQRLEVSQDEYAEFLNAVAQSDPNGLFKPEFEIGIQRDGVDGSYSYTLVPPSSGSLPIVNVSHADAMRYANWLHNGQPAGPQSPATTEDGAYTLTPQGLDDNSIARNPSAKWFIPSEHEWYKAAYYDASSGSYFDYPVASDTETICTQQQDAPNAASCNGSSVAVVGSYSNSPGPYGTFDQAGNVFEWTEGVIDSTRVMRGGSWFSDPADQASGFRASSSPQQQTSTLGFRVAPEPAAAPAWLACLGALALLSRRRPRSRTAVVLPLAATLAFADGAEAVTCTDHFVPAALAEGQPQDQTLYAERCFPDVVASAEIADTLIVFVHGITYDHGYWDVADPSNGSDRYSFVEAALARGYSTLGIDRLGAGQSSHPLSSQVTIDSNAHTVHEVLQVVQSGGISDPGGGTFGTVVLVGHSYGTWTSWFELTRYDDADAAVFTGATHGLTEADAPLGVAGNSYPAVADPLYSDSGLDPGYLTTQPNTRYQVFYAPGPVDPAVISADEATKGTVTNAEIQNYQLILDEELDIRVPVFLTIGSNDTLFCGPAPGGAPCTSEAELIAFEAPFLGPNVPSVDAYILPGGGHDMNPMWNAELYFKAVLDWVENTVLP